MSSNYKHYSNEDEKTSQLTTNDDDSDAKALSKAEALYISLMCFVASCLSSVTFEVGARSPLGHSVTKSATFNALFRRNYNMIIKIPMGNFVSSLISTVILTFGEKYRIPYFYLPWLVNTLKGMILKEGPALFSLSYNQLPYAVVPASTFGFMTIILFVEEFCLWCDVFASFKRCWIEYEHHKEQIKSQDQNRSMTSVINGRADGHYGQKIYDNKKIDQSKMEPEDIHEPDAKNTLMQHVANESLSLFNRRRTRSLIAINHSLCHD